MQTGRDRNVGQGIGIWVRKGVFLVLERGGFSGIIICKPWKMWKTLWKTYKKVKKDSGTVTGPLRWCRYRWYHLGTALVPVKKIANSVEYLFYVPLDH